jgi:protein-S-isoprenylcysteine O-methyltransferase Ste14
VVATDFEFRQRFWVIGAIFGAGFSCAWLDPAPAVTALADRLPGGATEASVRAIFAAAAALTVLAALLRTWASAYLRAEVVHDAAVRTERVVADGPYRHVRNPLYLALILLGIAFATLASRLGALVIVGGLTLFAYRLIGREERELERAQGASYTRFRDAVPRLLPALRPRLPASGAAPQWRQAVLGELFFWSFAAGLVAFAATLRPAAIWIAVGAGFALGLFLKPRRERAA